MLCVVAASAAQAQSAQAQSAQTQSAQTQSAQTQSAQTQSAQTQSAHVNGTAGYLSEWEFDGQLTQTGATESNAYSGSVTWKHVGLCSVNGPEQKSGAVTLQISKSGSVRQIHAMLQFDGAQCNYRGAFAGGSAGRMDCSGAKGIPLRLSIAPDQTAN